MTTTIGGLTLNSDPRLKTQARRADAPSTKHQLGQLFGHVLNAMPGYSTLGANITNPEVNYLGVANPGSTNTLKQPIDTTINGAPGTEVLGDATALPTAKALDTAQLNSLDSLIESLATIKDQALRKAGIKRDTSLREKSDEKKQEETKYSGKKLTTLQDFAGAKTDTDLNTRNTLENLISSLSVLGLGGSRALTRQILDAANMANRKANTTQAQNNQSLDAAWNDYTAGNENDIKKINDQYGYDEGEANRTYLQNKQDALYKKADVYNAANDTADRSKVMDEANGLNDMIAGAAFMNPSYTGEKRAMVTPELGSYTQDIGRYDTTNVGDGAVGTAPVSAGVTPINTPGNTAIRAISINDKDLGVKKKQAGDLGYGV